MPDAFLIDPSTGSPVVERGNFRRCSRAMSKAIHAVLTHRGSVPGLPTFGSRLHTVQHVGPQTPRDVRRIAEEALRPHAGWDWDQHRVSAHFDAANNVALEVSIFHRRAEERFVVPLPV